MPENELEQYALVLDGRMIDWVEAEDILEAGYHFMAAGNWPEGAVLTSLTALLRGM